MCTYRHLLPVVLFVALVSLEAVHAQDPQWQPTSLSDTSTSVRALLLTSGGVLYAAVDSTILHTYDAGVTWRGKGPARVHDMTEGSDGRLFAAGAEGVHGSIDRGVSWDELLPPRYRDDCGDFLHFFFVVAAPDGNIFTGAMEEDPNGCKSYASVYRSPDNGSSWSRVSGYFTPPSVLLSLENREFLYGSAGGALYKYDGNENWTSAAVAILDAPITSIVRLGSDSRDLLVGTGVNPLASGEGVGIYRSADGGYSWRLTNAGLTDLTITDLAVSRSSIIFASTSRGGIFRSTDNGDSWEAINDGLPSLNVTAIGVTDGFVFAGTDRGVYRSTVGIGVSVEQEGDKPEFIPLGQNYPNPFNPATTIPFELAEPGVVTLRVYDGLGREVARLLDEFRPAGRWEVSFSGEGMPSGVYVYRLESGSSARSGRMTLLK